MSLSTNEPPIVRTAETSTPILEVLAERWSPRSFDASIVIDERALTAALEERLLPISGSAVGTPAAPELLSDAAREREVAPRSRRSAQEIVIVNS